MVLTVIVSLPELIAHWISERTTEVLAGAKLRGVRPGMYRSLGGVSVWRSRGNGSGRLAFQGHR